MIDRIQNETTGVNSVTRIAVVDDHPIVRHGLMDLVGEEPDLVVAGEAARSDEVLPMLDEEEIDLLVLDLSLDGADGLELIKNVRAVHEALPILVVSTHDEKFYAERVLHAGAQGYLAKDAALEQIVPAIRTVRGGRVYLSEAMSDRLLRSMVDGGQSAVDDPVTRLSDREVEVFRSLGRGLGTRDIAEKLGLSVKTIETYRENIKSKLDFENANEMVRHAVQWTMHDV